jgi:hypothetical protein
MRIFAVIILVLVTFGVLYEGLGACVPSIYHNCIYKHSAHVSLYLVFGSIAPVMLLEASGRIPPDSSRAMTALAFLLAYVLWNEHALMKDDLTDNRVHVLLANFNLVSAALYAFSVFRPTNLVAYIAGWGMFVVQALWLLSAGANSDFQKININAVGPLFCLEVVFVTLSIVLVGAFFGRSEEAVKDVSSNCEESMNGVSVATIKGPRKISTRRISPQKDAYYEQLIKGPRKISPRRISPHKDAYYEQLQIEDDDEEEKRLEML